jgi:D-psicose/D-tagatose/L-ribulose 3-epimerase
MKFGAHSYMFVDRWTDDALRFLDEVRQLEMDCFEIGIGDDVIFAPEPVRRRAEELGLMLTVGPGGLWPVACDLSSEDPAARKAGLAWHKNIVDRASEIGATAYCGCLYGHPGVVKRRRPPADEYPRTAEGLHLVAQYAQDKGVEIVLEPMSHFRTHLVNTPAQIMRLIDLADHANLRVTLDTYHMITEVTDYRAAIRTVAGRLWGIHACENNRGVPGRGLVPWDCVFDTLVEVGFDGCLVMETYNSSLGDFAYERGMFHNVCPDAHQFIQEGLRFMRNGLCRARAWHEARTASPAVPTAPGPSPRRGSCPTCSGDD